MFYTDFFKNHVFGFLKPELCKGVLPNYIYLVDDLRQLGSYTGGFVPLTCYWDGLDFWAFSFRAKEENLAYLDYGNGLIIRPFKPYDLPKTPWEYKMRRTVILQNIMVKIVNKNKVVVPAEFQSGGDFDYSKKYSTVSSADNYFMKLGYPGNMIKTAYNLSIPDRREAIFYAIRNAEEGDMIAIIGKGHEDYQEIEGVKHHFLDREVVEEAVKG